MENQPEFSAVEPINEPQSAPPAGIEWGAIGAGLGVGVAWWLAQSLFWSFLFRYLSTHYGTAVFSAPWFSVANTVLRFASPVAYGTLIGFVVGFRARHHPYQFTSVVIILLFFATCIFALMNTSAIRGILFSSLYILWSALSFVLSLAAALNGAYLAQSVKRNRGVQIQ